MKDYVVYSLRLANLLACKGFQIKGVGVNKNNPKYNVYYFENTEELKNTVDFLKNNLYM